MDSPDRGVKKSVIYSIMGKSYDIKKLQSRIDTRAPTR